ncbi:MAG: Flp family type IVb pilin [Candidatus Hydrogenedentes bacterium]|nr:Flp family type IVb pilin [Candidatus Hydrogenedentota bacterium]
MKLRNLLYSFVRDERGLETVEYAVMTALIVAALVTAIGLLSAAVSGRFDAVTGVVDGLA